MQLEEKKKRGRPPKDQEVLKKNLLDSGKELFVRKGYHSTRIEDIVADAGVGKGTFYVFFKDKNELMLVLLDQFLMEINSTVQWTMDNIDENVSLTDVFTEEALKIMKTLMQYKDMAQLVLRDGLTISQEIEEKIETFYRELIELSTETLEFAIELGLMKKMNANVAAICIVGSIEKLYWQWIKQKIQLDEPELVKEILGFLLRGCGFDFDQAKNHLLQ